MRFLKPLIILVAVLAFIGGGLFAVYRDQTNPPRFTSEDFAGQDMQTAMQQIASATVEGGAPGVVIHIRQNGESRTVAAGLANKAAGQPMPTDTPLRIASISKIYTGAVIHHLLAQSAFELTTPISDLLPPEMLDGIPNADEATVRQLLQHTSGIPDYYDIRSYLFSDWREPITLERMLPVIRRNPATGAPGAEYHYSNTGYLLLGEIAETVSGKPMDALIEEVITSPLGLQATYYNQYQPVPEDIHGYGTYLRPWKDTHEYWEHSGPDGGVMASAQDVSAFLAALLIEDGPLSPIGANMVSEFVPRAVRRRQALGIETIMTRSGEELFGHTGDVFGYQTIAHALPERSTVIVAQVNCNCAALTSSLIANLYRAVEAIDGKAAE